MLPKSIIRYITHLFDDDARCCIFFAAIFFQKPKVVAVVRILAVPDPHIRTSSLISEISSTFVKNSVVWSFTNSMSDSRSEDENEDQKEEPPAQTVTFRSLGIKETLCEAIAGLGKYDPPLSYVSSLIPFPVYGAEQCYVASVL